MTAQMTPAELKTARKALGLTQEEMGLTLEVDPRTVRRWEAGPQAVPGPVKVAVKFMIKGKKHLDDLSEYVFGPAMSVLAAHSESDVMSMYKGVYDAGANKITTKKDPPA
jgi:DNA-binding XRE family transcriptional regulator